MEGPGPRVRRASLRSAAGRRIRPDRCSLWVRTHSTRAAALLVGGQGVRDGGGAAEFLGARVLDGHAAAGPIIGDIAWAASPMRTTRPVDQAVRGSHSTGEQWIASSPGMAARYSCTGAPSRKVLAEAAGAASHRLVLARARDVAEAVDQAGAGGISPTRG